MKDALEDFEVTLLLSAMEHRWGYDFRGYSRASIKRRIRNAMVRHRITQVSALIPRVLHEPDFFQDIVRDFSITVTEMFRDPQVWRTLLTEVFPRLATWPYFKVWHAACATGEEVYSMAILLKEAGLLDRATLYATDFNDAALAVGRAGVYPAKEVGAASRSYQKAGGQHALADYSRPLPGGQTVQMDKDLRDRMVWANHNLVTDQVFGEMNLIVCRNVLIYFTQPLQNRVLELFTASLPHGGLLCLGNKESLDFSSVVADYEPLAVRDRVFRRMEKMNDANRSDLHAVSERKPLQPHRPGTAPSPVVPALAHGVVAVGCSLGGMAALQTLLAAWAPCGQPAAWRYPVLLTQHLAASPDNGLADLLQQSCGARVKEAEEGETLVPGTVYVAPPDYHLLLCEDGTLALSSDERDTFARPSINVMLESVADVCGPLAVGVLLTGANEDGARGMAAIHAGGGLTLVQDPRDAIAPEMPQSALHLFQPDWLLPVADMAQVLRRHGGLSAPTLV